LSRGFIKEPSCTTHQLSCVTIDALIGLIGDSAEPVGANYASKRVDGMSRFGNLEFDSDSNEEHSSQLPLKDEDHFLIKAQEAFECGRFESALRMFARVIEFNPKLPAAWTGQVRMLIELGEFEEARVWADKALALFPEEGELLAAKGVTLARLGEHDGAISYSDAAVESQVNTAYIWLARADVLLARKEKRADYSFERALTLANNHWFVRSLAARIYAFYRQFARALKFVQEALSLEPSRAVLWLQAGECQLALGLGAQAKNSFEQARELDSDLPIQAFLLQVNETTILDKLAGRWRQWFGK
jgi:tetratricopeptide (TPR) repeat protein